MPMKNSVYDYFRMVNQLNKSKPFILDEIPRMLIAPNVRLPRNYVSQTDVCEIRFHQGTSYPYELILRNKEAVALFPAFTPVMPYRRVEYTEKIYDQTHVSLNGANGNRQTASVGPVNDYYKRIPHNTQKFTETMALPPFEQRQNTLCSRTKQQNIQFTFAETPDEFFAAPQTDRTSAAASTQRPAVLDRYDNYLEENDTPQEYDDELTGLTPPPQTSQQSRQPSGNPAAPQQQQQEQPDSTSDFME